MCFQNYAGWCTIGNDPYVWPFDSRGRSSRLKVFGHASYVATAYGLGLFQSNFTSAQIPYFSVEIRTGTWNDNFSQVSALTGVKFKFAKPGNQQFIEIEFGFENNSPKVARVIENNQTYDYPNAKWDEGTYFNAYTYEWGTNGLYSSKICTWSNICIEVNLQSNMLWVNLPGMYAGRNIGGLCGNYNQEDSDDRTLRDGTVLDMRAMSSHYNFASDWELPDTCTANCRNRRDEG